MGIFSTGTQNAIQKQLDSVLAAAATSAVLSEDVEALFPNTDADHPCTFVVDRIDQNGDLTPSKREYITFTGVSTVTLSGLTRNADGSNSDQEHAVGAIVEFVPDVLWAKSMVDNFADTSTAQTFTNKTFTSPKINEDVAVTATATELNVLDGVDAFLDENDMASDSATGIASQQSIKAYVDSRPVAIEFVIDGGGAAITTGIKGDLEIPFACTIVSATALADQSGSIVVDIWKDAYANFPPTDADSITASAPVTISAATKSTDSTLTGWTKTITAGDTLRFNVDSAATVTRVTVSLKVTRS